MVKIVITGSNGLLGQTLLNLFLKEKEKYTIIGFSRGGNRSGRTDFTFESIDIIEKDNLLSTLKKHTPDVIINTAAMTNVDACETQKEECNKLNINVVEYLKEYCGNHKTHLVHLSTDFIFDGKNGPYKETDAPNPLSHYGVSKLKSEEVLTKSTINYTILRTILVYGKVFDMSRNNIVLWVKKSLEQNRQITIVNDQYRMPTYVEELAKACKISIDQKAFGVFNISSNTLLSIYEIAQEIAEVFGLNKELIKPISTKTLNQTAPRPSKTGFDLTKTNTELDFYPKSFKEDLLQFKETLT
ncbi:dTDP-4-dehydrorhamnose reductase [Tenacibaculum holothuriorum]|uniref:dTDP-4-dehydrorhamnose reductase n=1 Tax=Tenacibaculum holothuriorum TaxID=1635173 RepID=A0A1Y2PE60_9FLAO|nr:SDR family oxidoreductase [Tenacibaculum holothuriorum]OSY88019.1 dTDP-4-dehydrorhamnose reductase [Tenacibaculum holothuriorum]